MKTDIESLLRQNRIDVGHYHSTQNNISLHCPFCGSSDQSQHMHVNVLTGACHCFRNSTHNCFVTKLLRRLGIGVPDELKFVVEEHTKVGKVEDYSEWEYFEPAEESRECLGYMEGRQFTAAYRLLKELKCKTAKVGKWAGRVIFPLTVGWTGRSVRPHISPKYLTNSSGGFFYKEGTSDSVIIVEGIMDALKVAEASEQFSVIAKCGMTVTEPIIEFLYERRYTTVYLIPDRTVDVTVVDTEFGNVRSCLPRANVKQVTLPIGVKDLGECLVEQTRSIIYGI
jgi:hypothetical protein